jgi:hypothetical protein
VPFIKVASLEKSSRVVRSFTSNRRSLQGTTRFAAGDRCCRPSRQEQQMGEVVHLESPVAAGGDPLTVDPVQRGAE